MHTYMDHKNLTNLPWHLLELTLLYITNLEISRHGVIMAHKVVILVHHLTITYACSFMCTKLTLYVSLIHCKTSPKRFFSKTINEDDLQQAIGEILAIIQDPMKTLPFLSYGDATKNLINQIAYILQ